MHNEAEKGAFYPHKADGACDEPFAVVVCDVNNLKTVNDLYDQK